MQHGAWANALPVAGNIRTSVRRIGDHRNANPAWPWQASTYVTLPPTNESRPNVVNRGVGTPQPSGRGCRGTGRPRQPAAGRRYSKCIAASLGASLDPLSLVVSFALTYPMSNALGRTAIQLMQISAIDPGHIADPLIPVQEETASPERASTSRKLMKRID